jgi:hypothetical protein
LPSRTSEPDLYVYGPLKAWTVFARLDAGIVGSIPTQGMYCHVLGVGHATSNFTPYLI